MHEQGELWLHSKIVQVLGCILWPENPH